MDEARVRYHGPVIGLIWNLSFGEVLVVGALAVMIFGGRLPEVAARVVHTVRRFRRSLDDLKRETGIDRELRNIEYEIREAERAARTQDVSAIPTHKPPPAAVEPPPGFRQARRVQGVSPDLSPGATPMAGEKCAEPEPTTPTPNPSEGPGETAPEDPEAPQPKSED